MVCRGGVYTLVQQPADQLVPGGLCGVDLPTDGVSAEWRGRTDIEAVGGPRELYCEDHGAAPPVLAEPTGLPLLRASL